MCTLEGLRIVVTRAVHQAEELAGPLRDLCAQVILLPMIGIAPPANPEALRHAAGNCDDYDWIIFTSANAIAALVAELLHPGKHCIARIATVGSATRQVAEQHGFNVSITPEKHVAESLVDAFREEDLNGRRILIPSAAVTRDILASELGKLGARVDVIEAYRNVIPHGSVEQAGAVFREPFPDWVTFASSSAVDNVVSLIGAELLSRVKIASIGPITSESVRQHGLAVATEATVHRIEGLVSAILQASESATH